MTLLTSYTHRLCHLVRAAVDSAVGVRVAVVASRSRSGSGRSGGSRGSLAALGVGVADLANAGVAALGNLKSVDVYPVSKA